MIAWSELGDPLLKASDNGYNVIVGSTAAKPDLFASYADHPRKFVTIKKRRITSSAAGRYQILSRYFDHYKKTLGLADFSPAAQDAIAIQLIRECRALADIEAGRIVQAIDKCKSRWASLPGAGYKQHEHKVGQVGGEMDLIDAFVRAGGVVV
jgi:muramidase (phage lysozyme)